MALARRTGATLIAAMLATPALSQAVPPVSEMRAKIDAYVAKSYPSASSERRTHVEYADINSDGVPEAFVIVTDAKACGTEPCALVLDVSDDRAAEIAVFSGQELRALQTKSGKWRDLMLDGRRLRWQDGVYR